MGAIHFLERIGVVAGVPRLGGNGHWGGSEVLHLLQMEIELLRNLSQLGHIALGASGMTGDEVGDELLVEMLLLIDAIEDALEVVEQLERGLAHQSQHAVAGVFRSHLQSTTYMAGDEFAGIIHSSPIGGFVLTVMQDEVVAHTAADETLLDTGQRIDSTIDVEQGTVVGIEIGTYLRMNTTGAFALLASLDVAPFHAIHIS